ncbi:MAG: acyltransferase [Nocardioides sp.]|jgi:acetyltransferase-like isoleucine patch superfamily enzyme
MSSASPWALGDPLTAAHRARLTGLGADVDVLADLDLRAVTDPVPSWWVEQGNALYLTPDAVLAPALVEKLTYYPFSDVVLVVASDLTNVVSLLLGGDEATVFIGPRTELTAGEIYCGARSAVVLNGQVVATRCPVIDARNGGAIVAAWDQLWAANVYVATDDMHRLESVGTGERINPYGATIRLGSHVWLGRDATLTGHVEIGDGAVVGARSMVRGQKVPARTAVAGTPARVIREGVTWRGDDTP